MLGSAGFSVSRNLGLGPPGPGARRSWPTVRFVSESPLFPPPSRQARGYVSQRRPRMAEAWLRVIELHSRDWLHPKLLRAISSDKLLQCRSAGRFLERRIYIPRAGPSSLVILRERAIPPEYRCPTHGKQANPRLLSSFFFFLPPTEL